MIVQPNVGSGSQLEGQWLERRQVTDDVSAWLQVLGLIHPIR